MQQQAHRPWPLPTGPWIMRQRWSDLLFAHWPVPATQLQPLLPPGLALDCFDGQAWLGVVPFAMQNVRPRLLPALPWLSAFPELNVRTYVRHGTKPGVWFFSLDAGNPVAVEIARGLYHLPYFQARMALTHNGQDGIGYFSQRTDPRAQPAAFRARYRPQGPVTLSRPGTLEHWLTERYCLYAASGNGRLYRGEIQHAPWPLQAAEAEFAVNTLALPLGLSVPDKPALLHFARQLEVVAWPLVQLPALSASSLKMNSSRTPVFQPKSR